MSNTFATELMTFALAVTGAERGMAVDANRHVLATANLPEVELNDADFTGLLNIEHAYRSGERPYITNNTILDPSSAPNTNTNFTNLRFVAIFPLDAHGAVYIDQHVSSGVIPQQATEQVMRVAEHLIAKQHTDITAAEMNAIYETL